MRYGLSSNTKPEPFHFSLILFLKGTGNPFPITPGFFTGKECPPRFGGCDIGYNFPRDRLRKGGQVQTINTSELYIDYGLLSGLAAMSEMRELLDELYDSLG